MPVSVTNGHLNQQLDAHEDRLQRVEATLQEVVASLAAAGVKLDFLAQRMEEQQCQILDRLDTAQPESHKTQGRLQALESELGGRRRRLASIKRWLSPLALAASGVIAIKVGELLWAWLSR